MPDQRALATEAAVGANHPTKTDTINRLTLIEHNNDGTHATAFTDTVGILATAREWTARQNFNETTLADGANISWALNANQCAVVTLAGNRTLDNPTQMVAGGCYVLRVVQDGTGSQTLAYGSAYDWEGNSAPTLSTGAADVDLLLFYSDGSSMLGTFLLDVN